MAVIENQNLSSMKILLDCGVDENSNTIIKTKTFAGVKATATNQDIYDVAASLVSLQSHELNKVIRVDNTELVGE